jgi:hypothetical protein
VRASLLCSQCAHPNSAAPLRVDRQRPPCSTDGPFGCLLADRIFASGATVSVPAGAKIEPEISVPLGADLAGTEADAGAGAGRGREISTPALPPGTCPAVELGNDLDQ